MLAESLSEDHWNDFGGKYRAFVGLVHTLANDPGATLCLFEAIGDTETNPLAAKILQVIDEAVGGGTESVDSTSVTPVFKPPQPALQLRAAMLAAYVQRAPSYLDSLYRESPDIINRSLGLRAQLKSLMNSSTDSQSPSLEAIVLYVFGTLLSNTPPHLYYPLLVNPNHVPFTFELLLNCSESFLNLLRIQQTISIGDVRRPKSEKFGILDAPTLLDVDFSEAPGTLGKKDLGSGLAILHL